jgi:ATP-dependent DNA helicase DinG
VSDDSRQAEPKQPAKKKPPSISRLLGPGGRLAEQLPLYEPRPQQVEVCEAIHEALKAREHCLVEAGTGVGKTVAYLIPALLGNLRNERAVVSTHTISLQTQLVEKDIPLVQSILAEADSEVVLMKGRGNYLCLMHLDAAESSLLHAGDPAFREIKRWAGRTGTGDVDELRVPYPGWYDLACDADTCRQKECKYYDRCFYYRMRRASTNARLIVVNHALYFSDLAARQADPNANVIPDHRNVIFDEAPHLEEVATGIFGVSLDDRRFRRFLDRLRRQRGLEINADRLDGLEQHAQDLFSVFAGGRQEFFFSDVLDTSAETRFQEVATQIDVGLQAVAAELQQAAKDQDDTTRDYVDGLANVATRMREDLRTLVFEPDEGFIRWGAVAERGGGRSSRTRERQTTLRCTPIEVGKLFATLLWGSDRTVVMTSATLSNSGGFTYLRSRLAIPEGVREVIVGSPFDYKRQAVLYVPNGLPEPPKTSVPQYTEAVADEIERIVRLTEGRAFLLFTSRRMLGEVYELLKDRLGLPIFRQGDQPSGKLLAAFRESGNGCLFGLQSFWEGVDVQGEALSCVVIDRLPFAVPDSPVNRARTQAITDAGGDWFTEYSMPQAQIRLKQGFGRLIRTKNDRGIVCILDTRLLTRNYGAEFVKYLPPAARASLWKRLEKLWHEGPE